MSRAADDLLEFPKTLDAVAHYKRDADRRDIRAPYRRDDAERCEDYVIHILEGNHILSFGSSAGRWHMGSGLDWVCKSVPRSNLRGSCLL